MSWNWRKAVSVGKNVLVVGFIATCAPFLVPTLVVASTIALISALPYCLLLVSYVCTEKLMKTLLPAATFGNKTGHDDTYDEDIAPVAMREPIRVKTEEEGTGEIAFREEDLPPLRVANIFVDVYQLPGVTENEDMKKKSKSLFESCRDDGRTNQSLERGISEKGLVSSDAKLEKVGAGKRRVSGTRHEGDLESTTTKGSKGKDMDKSSNEMKVLYNEEQIWAKMEVLRKIVGYSVARSTTYSEELKALYMFMGVEFPKSMLEKEDQDIAQVSERLLFLMSVIGIK